MPHTAKEHNQCGFRHGRRRPAASGPGGRRPQLQAWRDLRWRGSQHSHGLWKVGLGVYPAIPTSPGLSWPKGADALPERSRKRLYPVLVSLQSVLDAASPRSSWARRLYEPMSTRPQMNLSGMGVPEGWTDNDFWSPHISA
jgi:hypothetical protein